MTGAAGRRPGIMVIAATVALVLTSCTMNGSAGPNADATSSASGTRRIVITPAPYHLRAPVQREIAALKGRTAYLAGGLDREGNSADGVYSLAIASGRLTLLGSVPLAFHDAAGALIQNRLLVFGGGSTESSDAVQAFDLRSRQGSLVGRLPKPLSDIAAVTVGGTVYLVGGYDGRSPQTTIYATDDGTRFDVAGRLPVGLRYAAVAAVGSDLVIAGGEGARGPVSTVYVFDTVTERISLLGHLPAPVGHAAALAIGGSVYVVGGHDISGAAVASVVAIDPFKASISPAAALPSPVSDAAVVTSSIDAWLFGGWCGKAVEQVLEARLVTQPAAAPTGSAAPKTTPFTPSPTPAAAATEDARSFDGLLLVADRGNNRLLVLSSKGRIVWRYPAPGLPAPPIPFYFPDDAFWVHKGRAILVNEEENNVLDEIAYPSGRTIWTYGHPGVGGSSPGYLHQPDDAYPKPGGGLAVADAKNCRILFLDASGNPSGQIGTTGLCAHGLPGTVGYPNGDTPLRDGHLLLSELDGGHVSEVTGTGRVVWSAQIPGVGVPSDPQPLPDGTFLVADYEAPGRIVRFNKHGKALWSYGPASGPGELDHPSLAAPLPNGLIAVSDDYNQRVVLIDPAKHGIVWQYGLTNVPGSAPGYLNTPDGFDLLLPGGVIPLHTDFADPKPQPHIP